MNSYRLLLFVLAATVLTSCASLKKKGSSSFSDSKSPYVKEESAPKPKASTTSSSTASANNKAVVVREEKVKVVDNADGSVYNFYVILGSFKILDNAKNFRSQLTSEGFKPVILENEAGLYRVSVLSSNDEETARVKIGDIRNSYAQYSDVWLLVRKK